MSGTALLCYSDFPQSDADIANKNEIAIV